MCCGAFMTLAAIRRAAAASTTEMPAEQSRPETGTPASVEYVHTRLLAEASAETNPLTRTAA